MEFKLRKSPLLNLSALPLNRTGPDADVALPLPLEQVLPVPEGVLSGFPSDTMVQVWRLSDCVVIITSHPDDGGLRLSISHASRDPTWNEITQARYRLLPDEIWFAMYFPPRKDYVNIHRFCFQLKQVDEPEE